MKRIYTFFHSSVIALLLVVAACNSPKQPNAVSNKIATNIPKELALLNEQILKNNKNPDLYHARAKYFVEHGDAKSAADNMKVVMMLDSSKSDYFVTLADAYFLTNQTSQTKYNLERAVAKDEKNINALIKLAELYLYVRKNEISIEYANKVLKIDKNYAKAYFVKGMNFKELGDTAIAISSFVTATELDQEYYHAYVQLGLLCAAKKNPIAVAYYSNALNLNPKSEEVYYNLGMYYMDNKEFNKAIENFTTLTQINPNNREAYFNLGYIHFNYLNVKDQAKKYFTQAINVDPNFERAYYMRGYVLETLGDIGNAKKDYEKALSIYPQYELAAKGLERVSK